MFFLGQTPLSSTYSKFYLGKQTGKAEGHLQIQIHCPHKVLYLCSDIQQVLHDKMPKKHQDMT